MSNPTGIAVAGIVSDLRCDMDNCTNNGVILATNLASGIVSQSFGAITNCTNNGNVTGEQAVGGICGQSYGNITNCINNGNVTGHTSTGGINGLLLETSVVSKCYNTGAVTQITGENLGGICGGTGADTTTTIQNCYNTGSIIQKGDNAVGTGGIVGWISTTNASGTICNNYSIGEIKVDADNVTQVGGVIGRYATNTFTINNNYYLTGKSNVELNTIGEGKTEINMRNAEFITALNTGLDEAIWEIRGGENRGYPVIKGLKHSDNK